MEDYVNLNALRPPKKRQRKPNSAFISFLLGISLTLNYFMLKEFDSNQSVITEQGDIGSETEVVSDIGCIAELTTDRESTPQNFLCSLRGEHLKILSKISSIKFTEQEVDIGNSHDARYESTPSEINESQDDSEGVLCIHPVIQSKHDSSVLCAVSLSHIKILAQNNFTIELFKFDQ